MPMTHEESARLEHRTRWFGFAIYSTSAAVFLSLAADNHWLGLGVVAVAWLARWLLNEDRDTERYHLTRALAEEKAERKAAVARANADWAPPLPELDCDCYACDYLRRRFKRDAGPGLGRPAVRHTATPSGSVESV